jgi:hypothetical protein
LYVGNLPYHFLERDGNLFFVKKTLEKQTLI